MGDPAHLLGRTLKLTPELFELLMHRLPTVMPTVLTMSALYSFAKNPISSSLGNRWNTLSETDVRPQNSGESSCPGALGAVPGTVPPLPFPVGLSSHHGFLQNVGGPAAPDCPHDVGQ